jgi:hypothetical protein
MVDSFGELEASSLFCVRCTQATPVRKKLLLVLPSGKKYDYTCSVCGTQVGGKTDSDSSDFQPFGVRLAESPGASSWPPGLAVTTPSRLTPIWLDESGHPRPVQGRPAPAPRRVR